jgi:hypothetical protein
MTSLGAAYDRFSMLGGPDTEDGIARSELCHE